MKYYDVKNFGAAGDGKTKDTEAIQQAIDACANGGGGKVLLEKGTFLSGGLYLRTGVMQEIAASAQLLASGDISDYGSDTHHNRYRNEKELDRCFIYAQDVSAIGICGQGIIDGNAESFPNQGSIYRPMMIRFLRCKNIRLQDIRLYHAAAWTTAFLDSSDIWVHSVDIQNEKRYNGDGLDFDGCSHVFVSDCRIWGTDDNLCLQASNPAYPVQNIHIMNCEFTSLCAAIRIGLKSIGSISGVVIENCTMHEVWREGIKLECSEGGQISDILMNNISMRNVSRPLWMLLNNRFEPEDLGSSVELDHVPKIGIMKNIMLTNAVITDEAEMEKVHYRFDNDVMGSPGFGGMRIDAEEHHPIENVLLKNIFYRAVGGISGEDVWSERFYPPVVDRLADPVSESASNYYPDWSRTVYLDARNVKGLILEDLVFQKRNPDARPGVILENCEVWKQEIREL